MNETERSDHIMTPTGTVRTLPQASPRSTSSLAESGSRSRLACHRFGRRFWITALMSGTAIIGVVAMFHHSPFVASRPGSRSLAPKPASPRETAHRTIEMPRAQQRAIRLKTARAVSGPTSDEVRAPGRVAPDQSHFAFITPRAPGVVRSVTVNIGQEVHAGDVLATIDSPEVGRTRLELRTQRQLLEVSEAQAQRLEAVHANTLELIEGLKRGDEPDAIQSRLEGRPVGAGRERIMTAYSQYRLASAAIDRSQSLFESNAVSASQFQQARATYEAASATYQALLDSTEYDSRLANLQAQQARRQAEAAVDVARERLKILGVSPTDDQIEDASSPIGQAAHASLDRFPQDDEPTGSASNSSRVRDSAEPWPSEPSTSMSTYSLVAPFDGTILDRALVVPGVAVDGTGRLFTIADLSTVWLEVNVSEGDFMVLARAGGGEIHFESPAYPGRSFTGRVTYRGDLVDEASRTVKLLASAPNPDRLLKPGMFIEAEICCPGGHEAAWVPESALVTEGRDSFVFIRTGPERFERRAVRALPSPDGRVAIGRGLEAGDEVVIEGAAKLKAKVIEASERHVTAPNQEVRS